jgi:integrase
MASLQLRHQKGCALGDTFRAVGNRDGCNCSPTFYVFVHQGGKLTKEKVGKNEKAAQRRKDKLQVQEDEGTFEALKNIKFEKWADQWTASLERKTTTIRSYETTMNFAKKAFGWKNVRAVSLADISNLNALMREAGASESTRGKHLRVLHACFASAVAHDYGGMNPVKKLPKSEKPSVVHREAAYFTNDELPRLFAAIPDGLYRVFFETALKAGMREGELVALTWGDVDLVGGTISVRASFTEGELTTPKNRRSRKADVSADVVELLGAWWGECGKPEDDVLVFPGSRSGVFLHDGVIRWNLYDAMEKAGVPREGPTGERRTFHSFRHTYAKRALETGRAIFWLSRQLGHSSVNVTTERYGHWEASERKREAELMEGVFAL